jgi:hypothetical protein
VEGRKEKEVRRKTKEEWGKALGSVLGVERALDGEGRWSYFVFSLLFSYFVEGRFNSQSTEL